MAEKDMAEKMLADYNDVFADIVNTLLFDGKQIVNENSLQNSKDKSFYKADGKLHEQERDVHKFITDNNVKIAIVGFEHQTEADRLMPLRVIGYDGSSYRSQLLPDVKETCPVVTLVLYFGLTPWNSGKSLYDAIDIQDVWKPYVSNYQINVFEIAFLDPEVVKKFKSDFRHVADYFVQKRVDDNYIPSDEQLKHVDETLKLLSVLTGDGRFEDFINEKNCYEGGVSMCDVLDRVEARGEARGEVRGEVKAYKNMGKSAEEIASIMNKPIEVIKDILKSLTPQPSKQ